MFIMTVMRPKDQKKRLFSVKNSVRVCAPSTVNLLPGGELGSLREELGLGASLELQASVWLKAPSSCRRLWMRLYSWRRFWKICSVGSKQEHGQKTNRTEDSHSSGEFQQTSKDDSFQA